MRRRVVGADERLRAPQVAQDVGQDQRLLAREVRLVQRPRLRRARPSRTGSAVVSDETVVGKVSVEVSRKIWYEHIVAAALPSTKPPSYGVR